MKLLKETQGFGLDLNASESLLLSNVLNEVCNGFAVQDFKDRIGASEQEVYDLFQRVRSLSEQQHYQIVTSQAELKILQNALRETLRELGVEEFSIRTGVAFEAANKLLMQLQYGDN